MCLDEYLNISPGETKTITSPLYPRTPRSEFAYQCNWIIDVSEDATYLIEIIEFEGPYWFKFVIFAPGYDGERYFVLFESKHAPKSITIGNRNQLFLSLREEEVIPTRTIGQVFYANITALPIDNNGTVLFYNPGVRNVPVLHTERPFSIERRGVKRDREESADAWRNHGNILPHRVLKTL